MYHSWSVLGLQRLEYNPASSRLYSHLVPFLSARLTYWNRLSCQFVSSPGEVSQRVDGTGQIGHGRVGERFPIIHSLQRLARSKSNFFFQKITGLFCWASHRKDIIVHMMTPVKHFADYLQSCLQSAKSSSFLRSSFLRTLVLWLRSSEWLFLWSLQKNPVHIVFYLLGLEG